jgi:hypothetical protein
MFPGCSLNVPQVHKFLWDRMRSIRQDLTLQYIKDKFSVRLHEQMVSKEYSLDPLFNWSSVRRIFPLLVVRLVCRSLYMLLTIYITHYIRRSLYMSLTIYVAHNIRRSLYMSLTIYVAHYICRSLSISLTLYELHRCGSI